MTKNDVIKTMAEKVEGSTQKMAGEYLDAFMEVVKEALQRGDEVNLVGFAKFGVKETAEREVFINPRQQELGKKTLPKGIKPFAKASKTILK